MSAPTRQAVVFIHGIGEQRPTDTLRSFVDGLGVGPYFSKPDRLSELLELRSFTIASTSTRPVTDFYELYWAHHFDKGEVVETLGWAARLAFRRPGWKLNRTLAPVVIAIQVIALLVVALLVWAVVDGVRRDGLDTFLDEWQLRGAVILVLLELLLGGFLRTSVADAARYLTPRPRNIQARNNIRNEGITLLRRLHQRGDYVRVIVVGHSLGSVVGYDVLRHLWDEMRHPTARLYDGQPRAESFDTDIQRLARTSGAMEVEEFQEMQQQLWRENRARGVRWLVTDFITTGSPLAHAPLLLDTPQVSLAQRQVDREYPRCPPVPDPYDGTFYLADYTYDERSHALRVAHHGAVFATTRWTNLYFPVKLGILGDLVGGPVAPVFGPGVRDLPVRLSYDGWSRLWRRIFPVPHVSYWEEERGRDAGRTPGPDDPGSAPYDAVPTLRRVLALDLLRAPQPYPAADEPVEPWRR